MSTYYYKHNHTATRLHMLVSLAAVVLGVSSCAPPFAGDDTPDDSGTPVSFAAQSGWDNAADGTDGTRLAEGTDGMAFERGDAIGVFAYKNDSSTPDFMNNQSVTFDGTNWNYTPTKYWPQDKKDIVNFYACYPQADSSPQINVLDKNIPTITYDNINADIDWMAASATRQTYNSSKDGVTLDFQHLTAKVDFKFNVTGNTIYHPVVHVLKYNVPHCRGTLSFENNVSGFDYSQMCDGDSVQLMRYVKNAAGEPVGVGAARTIMEFTAYLFPCKFPCTDKADKLGHFTISLNNVEHICQPKDFVEVEAGKSYTVTFNIEISASQNNFFITSYSVWEEGEKYDGELN